MLDPGHLIFHPRYGFGTMSAMTHRDPLNPIQDGVSEGVSNLKQAYYRFSRTSGPALLPNQGLRKCRGDWQRSAGSSKR
jgi:hypothetical protein